MLGMSQFEALEEAEKFVIGKSTLFEAFPALVSSALMLAIAFPLPPRLFLGPVLSGPKLESSSILLRADGSSPSSSPSLSLAGSRRS